MSRSRTSSRTAAADRLDRLVRSWQADDNEPVVDLSPHDADVGWLDAPSSADVGATSAVAFDALAADDSGPLSWRERVNVGMDGRARRAVVALVAVVLGAAALMWWTGRPVQTTPLPPTSATAAASSAATAEVVVHVIGAVREPGVVRLPVGARVADAIDAAGGATRERALSSVNLARVLVDGEQIVVGQTSAGAGSTGSKVSLSTADAGALEELPGIGPALAARIVAWRDAHGPFASVDALDEVSGIGPTVLGQLRDLVVP